MKTKTYYVVVVKRTIGIDKYYRKIEAQAIELKIMNENLYPNARVTIEKEEVKVD